MLTRIGTNVRASQAAIDQTCFRLHLQEVSTEAVLYSQLRLSIMPWTLKSLDNVHSDDLHCTPSSRSSQPVLSLCWQARFVSHYYILMPVIYGASVSVL